VRGKKEEERYDFQARIEVFNYRKFAPPDR